MVGAPGRVMPIGLRNRGNTCYINATLQLFLSSEKFIRSLASVDADDPLILAMRSLVLDSSPKAMVKALKSHIDNVHIPNDSHEVMCHLLDAFSKNPVLSKLFMWKVAQSVTCHRCMGKSTIEVMHTHLMTPPIHRQRVFTHDAITEFCSPDIIPEWKCKCNKGRVSATKQTDIVNKAPLLFVAFDVWGKGSRVVPSEYLDVRQGKAHGSARYALVGFVGYAHNHYIAITKRAEKWYLVDDDQVVQFDTEVHSRLYHPYICLYEIGQ
jgi:ubiquitin C-terminal hydrolase